MSNSKCVCYKQRGFGVRVLSQTHCIRSFIYEHFLNFLSNLLLQSPIDYMDHCLVVYILILTLTRSVVCSLNFTTSLWFQVDFALITTYAPSIVISVLMFSFIKILVVCYFWWFVFP